MQKRAFTLFFLLSFFFSIRFCGAGEPASFPSLVSCLEIPASLDFCGERVPLDEQEVKERMEKEMLLSLWDRPQVILWLKRSSRYMPHIKKMLANAGLPDDLRYVALAESALRPHAGSKKGAVGFWQFMKHTGRKYGLKIDRRIDERRNVFSSTDAAVRYFKDLHELFGSWTLSAAAYNMGEGGLNAAVTEQGTRDYYQLYLPLETQRYIFRILSVKLIVSNPRLYGFLLSEKDYYPPLKFDRAQVRISKETPLRIIAEAAQTRFKVIKDLNPEIRGYNLAEGTHNIMIPKGSSDRFTHRLKGLLADYAASEKSHTYIVRQGDNLTSIAERFDVPLAAIILWNRLDPRRPIHPGDSLKIYKNKYNKRK